jgi:glycine/D-amino acid oxidase-like deaminating enzyme
MIDSIIVGYGLAGFNIAWQMSQYQKEFLIISDPTFKGASTNAAGVCNPTVLKRYTMAWNGIDFLNYAIAYYKNIESELDNQFFYPLPIHRIFYKEVEQNDWIVASQREGLTSFLKPELVRKTTTALKNKAGYGIVEGLGKLEINTLLKRYKETRNPNQFLNEPFDHSALIISKNSIEYKGILAKRIIFCEGFGLKQNPWFDYLPLVGSKGEYLIIKAPKLSRNQIIKGSVFISPMGKDLFWVGASFSRNDKTNTPTVEGNSWLVEKLNTLLNTPYEIVKHEAAVRPTVIDRRPLLGVHPLHSNIFILNGLGTRGVLMAPLLSKWLMKYIDEGKQIPNEVAINRFESYFSNPK